MVELHEPRGPPYHPGEEPAGRGGGAARCRSGRPWVRDERGRTMELEGILGRFEILAFGHDFGKIFCTILDHVVEGMAQHPAGT